MSRQEASQHPLVKSRMLPRLSLNSLLALTTIAALIAALARAAGQGGALARAALAAVAFIATCFVMFVLMFLIGRLAALVVYRNQTHRQDQAASPFAADQMPPQILPPREPPL